MQSAPNAPSAPPAKEKVKPLPFIAIGSPLTIITMRGITTAVAKYANPTQRNARNAPGSGLPSAEGRLSFVKHRNVTSPREERPDDEEQPHPILHETLPKLGLQNPAGKVLPGRSKSSRRFASEEDRASSVGDGHDYSYDAAPVVQPGRRTVASRVRRRDRR